MKKLATITLAAALLVAPAAAFAAEIDPNAVSSGSLSVDPNAVSSGSLSAPAVPGTDAVSSGSL